MFVVQAVDGRKRWISGVFGSRAVADAYLALIPEVQRPKHTVTDLGALTYPFKSARTIRGSISSRKPKPSPNSSDTPEICGGTTNTGATQPCTESPVTGSLNDRGPTTWGPCPIITSPTLRSNASSEAGLKVSGHPAGQPLTVTNRQLSSTRKQRQLKGDLLKELERSLADAGGKERLAATPRAS